MKKLIAVAFMSAFAFAANAQNQSNMDGNASQSVEMLLSNALDIAFTSTSSTQGGLVEIPFTSINDYVNGVETSPQEILVRSNKKFRVDVKTDAEFFTYTGSTTPTPAMPVSDVLGLKITANTTGGTYDGPFSGSAFFTLRDFNQLLLGNCNAGANQRFSVVYRATPGLLYPAGNYAINVVYTATQQ